MHTTIPEDYESNNGKHTSPSSGPPIAPDIRDRSVNPPSPAAQRKRAAKACLACRARKVRCDVSQHGIPCMNCRMSGGDCVAVGRPTKYRTSKSKEKRMRDDHQFHPLRALSESSPGLAEENQGRRSRTPQSGRISPAYAQSQRYKAPASGSTNEYVPFPDDRTVEGAPQWDKPQNSPVYAPTQNEPADARSDLQGRAWIQAQPQVADPTFSFKDTDEGVPIITPSSDALNGSLLNEICGILGAEQPQSTHTGFLRHSLIKLDDFSQSPPQDVEFLKSQGSFQIPVAPALDEFARRYFIHVHPHLPMIDESAFWDAFDGTSRNRCPNFSISIFTFQAMLFACCSFVPLSVLSDVGFSSIREARTTLYRRAKLLFDFNGKRDPISTAQGALLLSYSPDTNNRKVNTFWLGVAIQNARDANSHAYASTANMTGFERNVRKRLYWCCILRDRILPLGVRRPIYITDAHFDFSKNAPLNAKDLEGEILHSKVYDPRTKRSLAELLESLCELAVALTGIIAVLYPVNDIPIASLSDAEISRSHALSHRGRSDLERWYENATVKFPTPAGLGDTHESVILYTDLMYLYYHSAKMALCHLDLLVAQTGFRSQNASAVQLHRSKEELQESSMGITDIMKELLQLKLIKYLPISAVAYIALPLVLSILDVKLSLTKSQCATRQRRLQIFMEAMKVLQTHYDGTDRVSDAIERLIRYLAVNNSLGGNDGSGMPHRSNAYGSGHGIISQVSNSRQGVAEWGDVLVALPNCYLRIVITLDLSIARGEFPDEEDFPSWLQTSRLANVLPLYMMSQVEGEQPASNTSRIDKSNSAFDNYDNDRGRGKAPSSPQCLHTSSHAAMPLHHGGALNGRLQMEDAADARFQVAMPHRINANDIRLDTNAPRDVQLDAWMLDVLQDFN